jgi:UDP-4-amino-4,6-dideoxy-L-N-acetyl-beta-L-altrosamine transaminase
MIEKFIPYAHQSINEDDIQAVSRALSAELITRGPYVQEFEKTIADYCGVTYAVAFNSGSTALIAACHALQIGPHDRLISTPNTFATTVSAAMRYGAKPTFIDIDLETGNLDLDQLETFLKDKHFSRGRTLILPVDFAGIPVDMQKLDSLIRDPNTIVIEDAAHALGSTYKDGKKVGSCSWSDLTIFSFHPAKTITTGEGGMVTTNDPEIYRRLLLFRNNCIERDKDHLKGNLSNFYEGYYEVVDMTSNYHMTEFQAALGLSQFKRLNQFIEKRRALIQKYRELFKDYPGIKLFSDSSDMRTAFHLCVAQIDFGSYKIKRAEVMAKLKEQGIGTQVHYIPVYHHPFFNKHEEDLGEQFPNMEKYYSQALSLPLYYDLKMEAVEFVVDTLKRILGKNHKI